MDQELTRKPSAAPSAWFGFLLVLAAIAAVNAYAFLIAFPSPSRPRVPLTAPIAAGAFALLQIVFPACRPARRQLISPLNWVLLAFFLQLVLMPLTVSWGGAAYGMLPYLPSQRALDASIALSVAAFGAFSLGCTIAARRDDAHAPAAQTVPGWMLALYAGAGMIGLLLRFGSIDEIFVTLAEPNRFADLSAEQQGSLRGAASTFLRPFLLTAIVMAWCAWIDRRAPPLPPPRATRWAVTAVTAGAVAIVGATYSLNRAAFIVPLVAMAAAYSAHVRHLSWPALAVLGSLMGALAVVPGQYRSSHMTAAELAQSKSARRDVFFGGDLGDQLQVYGSAPQFTGYLLEAAERNNERFTPSSLLASLLSPVPILGKAFRDSSGPALYNRLIYGNDGIADQNIPFEGEVYLCLGPAGLVGAFLLIGAAIGRLQRSFSRAATAFESYALQFTATWVAFLVQGSLAAMAQVFVFFFWPIYGYALLRLSRRMAMTRRG
jgi:hypothetical protein